MEHNLIIKYPTQYLPTINNEFFYYGGLFENGVMASEGFFKLKHPIINDFTNIIGKENTFYIYRVFLSYYEANVRLQKFWRDYANPQAHNLQNFNSFDKLEDFILNYEFDVYTTGSLKSAQYLKEINSRESEWVEFNSFKEYLWSNNMNKLLASYGITPFKEGIIMKGHLSDLFNSGRLYKLAIKKREISSVLYEWAQIDSLSHSNFVKSISNIFELIKKDLERNNATYQKIKNATYIKENVFALNDLVQNQKRGMYFGIFNASDLLGPYSRHFSKELVDISGVNNNESLKLEDVITQWRGKSLLPSDRQFNNLFKSWYLTASILLLNWLRLNHEDC